MAEGQVETGCSTVNREMLVAPRKPDPCFPTKFNLEGFTPQWGKPLNEAKYANNAHTRFLYTDIAYLGNYVIATTAES